MSEEGGHAEEERRGEERAEEGRAEETGTGERRTEARVRRSRWPGWIWAVPIAAIGIVGWLALRNFVNRGPEITVTFPSASGVMAGQTKVRYKGIDVGEVEDVALSKDLSHVTMTLRMQSDVEKALTEGTRFWIVGASLSAADLSALKTIVSGPFIAMDPGPGKPARHFAGLEQPPVVTTATAGTRFTLHAKALGSIASGADIDYLGLSVGKVESAEMTKDGQGFAIGIFVRAPYDKLVHAGTRFWNAGAVDLSLGDHGVKAQLVSLTALISGAVAFATSSEAASTPPAKPGQRFELYDDAKAAQAAPSGRAVAFLVRFAGPVGDVPVGAPVKLKGFRIGEVTSIGLAYDAQHDRIETPMTIAIDPARLKIEGAAPPADGNWAPTIERAVGRLVAQGLRARLERSTPVVGGRFVALALESSAQPAKLETGGAHPEIPTAPSADIAGLTAQAHGILAKIDNLPLAQIAESLRETADHVSRLSGSPELADALKHVDRSAANIESLSQQARSKIGPLVESLRKAADDAQQAVASANAVLGGEAGAQDRAIPEAVYELANAARAVRSLANYLDRHPEALLHGKPAGSP